ncbi:MAG: hypothetical protein ACJ759_15950 [Thermoanaerobaculia bacterium]
MAHRGVIGRGVLAGAPVSSFRMGSAAVLRMVTHISGGRSSRAVMMFRGGLFTGRGIMRCHFGMPAAGSDGAVTAVRVPFASERLSPLLGFLEGRRALAGDALFPAAPEQRGKGGQPAGQGGRGHSPVLLEHFQTPHRPARTCWRGRMNSVLDARLEERARATNGPSLEEG